MTLTTTRRQTSKALRGLELPAAFAQATCAAAANAYERATKSAVVSRRRLSAKAMRLAGVGVA